jgi:hypothetical protein
MEYHALVTLPRSFFNRYWIDVKTAEATGTTKTIATGQSISVQTNDSDVNNVDTAGLFIGLDGEIPYNEETEWGYKLGSADFAELEAYLIIEYIEFA